MASKERDLLEVLRLELEFLKVGATGRRRRGVRNSSSRILRPA